MESILSQNRISLSKAAQISGYHQDYLGQLCRLGKLKAAKIGRNWYTTAEELQALANVDQSLINTEAQEETPVVTESVISVTQPVDPIIEPEQVSISPVVASNYVVSQVEDMPIQIEQVPHVVKSHHTLQTLITRMKLEELRTDVLQVTGLIGEISEEVNNHTEILKRHEQLLQNRVDLKNSYSPSISVVNSNKPIVSTFEYTSQPDLITQENPNRVVWLWPALALLLAVVASGLFMISINSSDTQPQLTTVIYKTDPNTTEQEPAPQVAGDQTTTLNESVTQP